MPPQDSKAFFKNHANKIKRPAVIFADFESLLLPFYGPHHDQTKTNINNHHLICSFCYIIYSDDTHSDPVQYRGPNAASTFLKAMLYEYSRIQNTLPTLDQDICPLCEEPILTPHEKCSNILTKSRSILPIFFTTSVGMTPTL